MRAQASYVAPLPRAANSSALHGTNTSADPLNRGVTCDSSAPLGMAGTAAAGSRRERRGFGKLRSEPVSVRPLSGPTATSLEFSPDRPGRFGAGRMVAVGSAEPAFVRAVVQVLACDLRTVRPRVCERLACLDPDRVDRRGRRRGRRDARAPASGFCDSEALRARRAADAADRCAARARVAPCARDSDAAAAGELGCRAARHVGQHALRRRHALAPAGGRRRAVRARIARSEVDAST